ncbi:hypothetical protein [Rhodococcus sp. ARC_M6]|uniref:hypothetical protein n=1 Tax=Rhodococcus sp. ARC_M6 TaxID=2928852 RepID=UPI001FB451D0|nr:hypothetical protein [Rhodococcus sp. ARC_M6]MCJ0907092.1 hypothetical protein [Rhodococcus sp. ARC_M6]
MATPLAQSRGRAHRRTTAGAPQLPTLQFRSSVLRSDASDRTVLLHPFMLTENMVHNSVSHIREVAS